MTTGTPYLPRVTALGATSQQQDDRPVEAAGLVAGVKGPTALVGVAPGARIVGVGVYDPSAEDAQVDADDIARGIDTAVGAGARTVVVIVATAEGSPALSAAVAAATRRGALVVAAVQAPDTSASGSDASEPASATFTSYPAAVPGVVGVGIDPGDGTEAVPSPDLTLVAPVVGAVVPTANGSLCDVDGTSALPSMAAAEVGGVAALLRARYPSDSPAQLATRLTATAAGNGQRTSLYGFGTVQAGDAAQQLLRIAPDGALAGVTPVVVRPDPVRPPAPPGDRFAQFRTSLLWWGVLAGGGLALALVLRPLRRR